MIRKLLLRIIGIEWLAEKQHEIWSHWMKYMFTKGDEVGWAGEKGWLMPVMKITLWKRQMDTPYSELLEHEKESDRKVVRDFYLQESEDN